MMIYNTHNIKSFHAGICKFTAQVGVVGGGGGGREGARGAYSFHTRTQ